jgi:ribosomal protein S12 methylthiotransferase
VALGTRELTLISEDSTDWGKDLGRGERLADLLAALGEVTGLAWVRVMYAHPATIDERLIETLAAVPNVLPYLDMPVQHGDEAVLAAMRRGTSPTRIRRVVRLLREAIPEITLRTTILVGFPGENEARFRNLLDLLEELAFDRVGCFVFSPEKGTEGARLRPRVSRAVAEQRRERVMELQQRLLRDKNRARIGREETVLVDGLGRAEAGSGRLAVARSAHDAPEVDGRVIVELPPRGGPRLRVGEFTTVTITGEQGYDVSALPA